LNSVRASDTIAVAMSGGVDSSSTVAAMLRAEGHNVIGLTMQLWNQRRLAGHEGMPESVQGRCCSIDDVYDARRVAETLGIPYYVVNHEERLSAMWCGRSSRSIWRDARRSLAASATIT
jgi:tRNA-specific 2-thiouridylase